MIVEILSFLPSILLVQFFRRIQSRRAQRQLSPLREAISQMTHLPAEKKQKRASGMFPWWCLFVAYGLSAIMAAVSIFFVIVRGVEFGDVKCQKWLTSLFSSFFSSVILVQPLKVSVHVIEEKIDSIFSSIDHLPGRVLRAVLSSEGKGQGGSGVHR